MMILTSPTSAISSTNVTHFSGLIAPAAWGVPFQLPGPSPPPGPGQFPPPPLLVFLIPLECTVMTSQGSINNGHKITLIVLFTDPETNIPTLSSEDNSSVT